MWTVFLKKHLAYFLVSPGIRAEIPQFSTSSIAPVVFPIQMQSEHSGNLTNEKACSHEIIILIWEKLDLLHVEPSLWINWGLSHSMAEHSSKVTMRHIYWIKALNLSEICSWRIFTEFSHRFPTVMFNGKSYTFFTHYSIGFFHVFSYGNFSHILVNCTKTMNSQESICNNSYQPPPYFTGSLLGEYNDPKSVSIFFTGGTAKPELIHTTGTA